MSHCATKGLIRLFSLVSYKIMIIQDNKFKRNTSILCQTDVVNKNLSIVELNVMSHYLIWIVVLSLILGDVKTFQR